MTLLTQIGVEFEGDELILPIFGITPKDSLLVRQITGLNPPDINLFIGEYSRDGGIYQGRRVGNRNPVITLDLNPNPALGETISSLREILYKAFVDPLVEADYVKLNLHDDVGRVRYLVGYTEKFETEIFAVETMAQISMICPDPYIRDNDPKELTNSPGWIAVPFSYEGTAETGFEVEIYFTSTTSVLTVENNNRTMVITSSLTSSDVVYLNTIRGSRALMKASVTNVNAVKIALPSPDHTLSQQWQKLMDDGNAISIVAGLSPESPWLELHSQSNTMKVYGATSGTTPAVIRMLVYTPSYWGV